MLPVDESSPRPPVARRRASTMRRNIIGFAIGMVLLAAAAWVALTHEAALSDACRQAVQAPLWLVALALGLPALNWVLTSLVFLVLNGRYARVPPGEIHALIGAAWLLNYLPMRPGMFGRIAWHRTYHGITVTQSAKVIGWSMLASALAFGALLAPALIYAQSHRVDIAIGTAVMIALIAAGGIVASGRTGDTLTRRLWFASLLRYADALIWAARYAAIFALVGRPIGPAEAVALAIVSQAATIIPISGNGLGVREWAVGALAAVLPSESLGGRGIDGAAVGVAADLVHRGLEVLSALVVAPICMIGLERIRRRRKADFARTEAQNPSVAYE